MGKDMYTVWVGGAEVSQHYLTYAEAVDLAKLFKEDGYTDVVVELENERNRRFA